MFRQRIYKKRSKNRQTLIRNLNKGKARKEARCQFQSIPYPLKFTPESKIYPLCADVVLAEKFDTLVAETCLYNHSKLCKNIRVTSYEGQKLLTIQFENKVFPTIDEKGLIERLAAADSHRLRQWSDPIKRFCERHDAIIQEFHVNADKMSSERIKFLEEMNVKTERTRQNIKKTYPCIEFKAELKNGKIELNQITVSEKYIAELGYSLDSFAFSVLHEGLPEVTPLESEAAVSVGKLRVEKYLIIDQDGFSTPVFQTNILVRGEYMKKVQMRIHYMSSYENGVLGFMFMGCILAKQKPFLCKPKLPEEKKINHEFVDMMKNKEKEMGKFLSEYYGEKIEQKYTNMDRVCQIREIKKEAE